MDAGQVNRFTLTGEPVDGSAPQTARKPEQAPKTTEKVAANVEDLVPQRGERISKIKQFTRRLKSPQSLIEMENVPAYKRRNVQLDDVQHSSNSNVSRVSFQEEVDEDGEKRVEIRTNNPFLHDNVD
jgi:cell division protein FtsZ